jgi:hypothetical protein
MASLGMTRAEIESEYTVVGGVIRTPGKFEGEPVYAPAVWVTVLDGFAAENRDGVAYIEVDAEIAAEWPELAHVRRVYAEESDSGFVSITARGVRKAVSK